MNIPTYAGRPGQAGASLMVVLILLLVMTLLGLAVLRGTLLEERMSSNLYDRSLAFQAAESALRAGEVLAQGSPAAPASGCNAAGVCSQPDAAVADRWLNTGFTAWANSTDNLNASGGAAAGTPQFIVEFMGVAPTWPGCDRMIPKHELCEAPRYRVTARSAQANRAQVILQTNFIVQ